MARIRSFAPVECPDATVLILGSMPGRKSLEAQQYYAHPANAFWKIMGELVGARPELPYAERLHMLRQARIALWDVLHSCERESSLDSDIEQEAANDFAGFFARHPRIMHVYFNGAKAEQSFRKFVLGKQVLPKLELYRLPSTSPAHAGMGFEEKLKEWKKAKDMNKTDNPEDIPAAFQAAWNAHDMNALGSLFAENATFVNRFGHYVRGVDEIVALHAPLHQTIYSDSTLKNELIDVIPIADGAVAIHFWSRLTAGAAHPAGPHQVDTLILAVLTKQEETWRIRALENVTLTNPRTGETILRA